MGCIYLRVTSLFELQATGWVENQKAFSYLVKDAFVLWQGVQWTKFIKRFPTRKHHLTHPKYVSITLKTNFFVILSLILCSFYKDFSTWLKSFSFIIPWNLICVFWYIFDIFEYQTVFFLLSFQSIVAAAIFLSFPVQGHSLKTKLKFIQATLEEAYRKYLSRSCFSAVFSIICLKQLTCMLPFLKDVAKHLGHWLGLDLFIKMC